MSSDLRRRRVTVAWRRNSWRRRDMTDGELLRLDWPRRRRHRRRCPATPGVSLPSPPSPFGEPPFSAAPAADDGVPSSSSSSSESWSRYVSNMCTNSASVRPLPFSSVAAWNSAPNAYTLSAGTSWLTSTVRSIAASFTCGVPPVADFARVLPASLLVFVDPAGDPMRKEPRLCAPSVDTKR